MYLKVLSWGYFGVGGMEVFPKLGIGGHVMLLPALLLLGMAVVIHGLMAASLCVINKHSQES